MTSASVQILTYNDECSRFSLKTCRLDSKYLQRRSIKDQRSATDLTNFYAEIRGSRRRISQYWMMQHPDDVSIVMMEVGKSKFRCAILDARRQPQDIGRVTEFFADSVAKAKIYREAKISDAGTILVDAQEVEVEEMLHL